MNLADNIQRRIQDAALRLYAETGATRINVRDLAHAAGVARGTIYNNVASVDTLFEDLAAQLAAEMHERVHQSFGDIEDPARRLATGIRLFMRRSHDEPAWGRFMCRFGMNTGQLREIWHAQPMRDLQQGIANGRYDLRPEQLPTVTAMLAGSMLAASLLVLDGYRGWREASTETTVLLLRALGIGADEARALAETELPELPARAAAPRKETAP
jgi:AcrR family transcriptional regulator